MDAAFEEGGLPLGCIHEFTGKGREQEAAAHGFLSGVLSQTPPRAGIMWITRRKTVFPPGLVNFGLTPDRIIFVEPRQGQGRALGNERSAALQGGRGCCRRD